MAATVGRPLCRHCKVRVGNPWKRGLCYCCYFTPGRRELYPSGSKFARTGLGTGNGRRPPPAVPCPHPPGTPGKLAALAGRAERGEHLWHPADNTGAA